jgi:UDP-2,3-diacylglucosamine pyrophosphatase LpxH
MRETIIVSDVHLGSRYCLCDDFIGFLDRLPAEATLVLNGDTVDRRQRNLPPRHAEALDRLRAESLKRRVVWLRGNHDARYRPDDPQRIETALFFSLGRELYVSHGFHFDRVMPQHRLFIALFRLFHGLRVALGAPSAHVAHYAKRFAWLYRLLTDEVARDAAAFARANGYKAVTCGHTHHVEDRMLEGVRYINTGSWTEPPLVYLRVEGARVELREAGRR